MSALSGSNASSKCSMIVPVLVSHQNYLTHEVQVYALLDTQLDATFSLESVCDTLRVEGTKVSLLLSTLTSEDKAVGCRRVNSLVVRGVGRGKLISLPTT